MRLGIAGPVQIRAYIDYLEDIPSLNNPLPHGLGSALVVQLTLALLERGYELVIFTLDNSVSREIILEGPGIKICIGPYRTRRRARDFFQVERAYLKEAIQREKPDLVHAHWTYEFALGSLASGVPTVITAHDAPLRVLWLSPTPYFFMRTLMSFKVAHQAQHLTAVSPYVAKHFKKVLRYPRPIKVIPNGLEDDLFEMGKKGPGATRDELVFATVLNGWGRLKNSQVVLEAFKHVHNSIPKSRLLMFGIGHGKDEQAPVWAKQRDLSEGVEFVGELPYGELLQRLAYEVDILVHPSLEESFSMAIAEAMAMGIPVIGGINSGGVPFTLEDGNAGLLVDVRSPTRVAEAMLRLARDPVFRSKMGQLAQDSAGRRFHITKVADAYVQAYEEALAGLWN